MVGCEFNALLDQGNCPGRIHGDSRTDAPSDSSHLLRQTSLDITCVYNMSCSDALRQLKTRRNPVNTDDGFTTSDLGTLYGL